ncbi:MAG: HAD family hydrolase [Eubacteriales bacterium]|nr:HAD family hydrolase [Eubacteriales bacterium]
MSLPKMILFDAGKTLVNYGEVPTTLKSIQQIYPYITHNPNGWTCEDIERKCSEVFDALDGCRAARFEVPEQTGLKLLFDILDISFSLPMEEIERIYGAHFIDAYPVEQAEEFLTYLHHKGIRTGVISNFIFSSSRLLEWLTNLYPNNEFEFVVTSSDYGIRKPNKLLFEVAVSKSRLSPGEIWYVGDKAAVDVAGSQSAGMVPVLYNSPRNKPQTAPDGVLSIHSYDELTKILEHMR